MLKKYLYFMIGLVIGFVPTQSKAYRAHDQDLSSENNNGLALRCENWAVEFQAGVAPTVWTHRQVGWQAGECIEQVDIFGPLFKLPRFKKLWHVPAQVGGKLDYAFTNHIEGFAELNYRTAHAKQFDSSIACVTSACDCCPVSENENFTFLFNRYRAVSGYVGVRCYSERYWCETVSFFVGIKVGATYHHAIEQQTITTITGGLIPTSPFETTCAEFYKRGVVVSGGGLFGFDWYLCNNFSFIFTAEVVGTGAPLNNNNVVALSPFIDGEFVHGIIPGFSAEVVFPITFGFKYSF